MWNYRIIKDKETYGLYEVMYNDDGEICAHSEKPEIIGESPEDLLDTLQLMLADTKKHFSYFYPPEVKEDKILDLNKIKFSEFCKDIDKGEEITLEQLDDILKDLE
jgi:restriction endonuclease